MAIAGGSEVYAAVAAISPLPANLTGTGAGTAAVAGASTSADIDGDGNADIAIGFQADAGANGNWFSGVTSNNAVNNIVGYVVGSFTYASRLDAGVSVGPASAFVDPYPYFGTLASRVSSVNYGAFKAPNTTGFVGFSFLPADLTTHYGWLQIRTSREEGIVVLGGGYETTANTAILTGAVPEPTSLAGLALGAAALLKRRGKKAA